MASRHAKRPQRPAQPATPAFDPLPMFDLDAYCAEHAPSIKRIRAMQEAAQGEAHDEALPLDARRHHLTRMKRWLDTLIDQLDQQTHEGDDHDPRHPDPRSAPGKPPGGRSPRASRRKP